MRLSPGTRERARHCGDLQRVLDRAEALRFVRITLGGHVSHEGILPLAPANSGFPFFRGDTITSE